MRETKYNQNSYNRKAPIDHEALWGKIKTDSTFPKPESKSPRRFWIIGGLIVLFLLSALTYTFTTVEQSDAKLANSTLEISVVENSELDNNSFLIKTSNQEIVEELQTSENATISDTPIEVEKVASVDKLISHESNERKEKFSTPSTPTTPTDRIVNQKQSQSQAPAQKVTTVNERQDYQIIESQNNSQSSIQTKQENLEDSKSKPQRDTQNSMTNRVQFGIDPIADISAFNSNKLESNRVDFQPSFNENLNPIKSRLDLQIYFNASYGLSINSVNIDADTLENFSDREDLSKNLQDRESRAIEFGVKKRIFKRFNVGLGAEYREDWQVYQLTTIDTLVTAIPNEEGRIGLAEVTTNYKLHQNYKSVNMLLTGGYLIPTRIGLFEVGGGLSYNLGIGQSGNVLDNELQPIARTRVYELKGFGFSGFGHASLTIPLSDQLRLSMNARYDVPTTISSNDAIYKHQLSAMRLGVGLGYAF